jgi:hypothetical protein
MPADPYWLMRGSHDERHDERSRPMPDDRSPDTPYLSLVERRTEDFASARSAYRDLNLDDRCTVVLAKQAMEPCSCRTILRMVGIGILAGVGIYAAGWLFWPLVPMTMEMMLALGGLR